MPAPLTEADYQAAATSLACDVPAIKAVAEVESAGSGFNPDGTVKVLFEGHVFYRETSGRFKAERPDLCFKTWTKAHYSKSQEGEHKRLSDAERLDRKAALRATSFGRFQIMGFNHEAAGFRTVQKFVNAMYESEAAQLDAFVNFVLHEKLDDELRDRRWADFARRFNGPGYRVNRYDEKLAKAFEHFSA